MTRLRRLGRPCAEISTAGGRSQVRARLPGPLAGVLGAEADADGPGGHLLSCDSADHAKPGQTETQQQRPGSDATLRAQAGSHPFSYSVPPSSALWELRSHRRGAGHSHGSRGPGTAPAVPVPGVLLRRGACDPWPLTRFSSVRGGFQPPRALPAPPHIKGTLRAVKGARDSTGVACPPSFRRAARAQRAAPSGCRLLNLPRLFLLFPISLSCFSAFQINFLSSILKIHYLDHH